MFSEGADVRFEAVDSEGDEGEGLRRERERETLRPRLSKDDGE